MPLISIIIPCFNAEPWIRETLRSVIEQGIEEIEIIVVDDGSRDSSPYIVEKEFPFVHLIKTRNEGPSRARNLGTGQSKGEFIQYLDADDLLAPGKLKIQSEALRNSEKDIAYGDWQKLTKAPNGQYVKGEIIRRKLQNPEIDLFTDFWAPPAVYLFRRSIIQKVGQWNEDLPVCEDVRFILDCVFKGGTFVYCKGPMAYFRVRPAGESASTRDPSLFLSCCFKNAVAIENRWRDEGGISKERKQALLKAYGYVARASFEKDKSIFEVAYQNLERLKPGYVPEEPWHLRLTSIAIGYRGAEGLALLYRNAKKKLGFR